MLIRSVSRPLLAEELWSWFDTVNEKANCHHFPNRVGSETYIVDIVNIVVLTMGSVGSTSSSGSA